MMIHMFDLGGQGSESKKWMHCFESQTCLNPYPSVERLRYGLSQAMGFGRATK
ncbi:hypothetical protein B0H16DRAFT_1567341 [Mycena metata]|uniref:Uncharacterized protein n=1 Tax=Mycena metata TaxID=1033252 RepID=A0AAD7IEA8_9AGAR|nr:hypothetical protein B0H16DRAFT_1567341 [Mycena metata]